jgi:hypothetical protein
VKAAVAPAKPMVMICEDGEEYLERFSRFLGDEFAFVRVTDFAAARAACAAGPIGILCDMDFRRLAADRLVDEAGASAPGRTAEEVRRLTELQGALILRALRAAGVRVPALLFVDLDDPARVRFLERTLAPLAVVSSGEGLPALAARLRAWAAPV